MKRFDTRPAALFTAGLALSFLSAIPAAGETLTPRELAELTKRDNGTVVSARFSEREAAGRLQSARGAGLPAIGLDARSSWLANPADAVTLPAGSLGSLPVPSPASPALLPAGDVTLSPAQDPLSYSAALSVDQALWTWGKLSAAEETREREVLLAGADAARAEASALADLYRSLYALSYQRDALSIARSQAELSSRMLASVASSRAAGTVTDLDYEEAALNAERISRSRASLEDSVAKLERSILLAAGLDPSARGQNGSYEISVEGLAPLPEIGARSAADWSARARSGNLDLAYARRGADVRASAEDLSRRQAAGKPDVGLNLRAGWNGSGLPGEGDWSDRGDWFAAVTVSVKGSLFDFGTSAGKVAESEAAAARSVSDLDSAAKRVDAAVTASLADLKTLKDESAYRDRLASFRGAKAADAEARRSVGAGSELAALQAQSDWLAAVLDAAGARMQYTNACVSLLLLADPSGLLTGEPFGSGVSPAGGR